MSTTIFRACTSAARGLAGYLSGGEQQMLAIGRALIARPKLILLDEPSLGLSPVLVEEIFAIIARINAERGVSMLLVEQNAAMALSVASYGYIMETGKIVIDGHGREAGRRSRRARVLSRRRRRAAAAKVSAT